MEKGLFSEGLKCTFKSNGTAGPYSNGCFGGAVLRTPALAPYNFLGLVKLAMFNLGDQEIKEFFVS